MNSDTTYMELVPATNLDAYIYLYTIEVFLRELIIDRMESAFGPTWWKVRLRSETQRRPFELSMEYEREHRWMTIVSHHPVHYLLFTDLKEIILRRDNWREVFAPIFQDDAILRGSLSEIEPIRNKVAHSRIVSPSDVRILESTLTKLSHLVGPSRFDELCRRKTQVVNIAEQISLLRAEAISATGQAQAYKALDSLPIWRSIDSSWWLDSEYLGSSVEPIKALFRELQSYSQLPRPRGGIYNIEQWVKKNNLHIKLLAALQTFDALLITLNEEEPPPNERTGSE